MPKNFFSQFSVQLEGCVNLLVHTERGYTPESMKWGIDRYRDGGTQMKLKYKQVAELG